MGFINYAMGTVTEGLTKAGCREGTPSIRVVLEGNVIYVTVSTLREGEEKIVAERLKQLLSD